MTTMTLADSIRLGAMSRKQSIGMVSRSGGVCAIGGALLAHGKLIEPHCEQNYANAFALWPHLRQMNVIDPVNGCVTPLIWAITSLNDCDGWTREAIATWVDSIDPTKPRAGTVEQVPVSVTTSASAAQEV